MSHHLPHILLKMVKYALLPYALVLVWAYSVVVPRVYTLSRDLDAGGKYSRVSKGLWDGWLFGYSNDLSDIQWREFRKSLPQLGAALLAYVSLSRMVRAWQPAARVPFSIMYSFAVLGALHGSYAIHVVLLCLLNYMVAKLATGSRYGLPIIWAWNCGTLLAARLSDGLPFAMISPSLAFLDAYKGPVRWHIVYNMLLLRQLSFASDLHWWRIARPIKCAWPVGTPPSPSLDNKARKELPLPSQYYNLPMYLAYALYPPLYVAGPTMTFNSFASQIVAPAVIPAKKVLTYAIRWCIVFLVLEVMTHCLYSNAITRFRLWKEVQHLEGGNLLPPLDFAAISYCVLVFMWLKFTAMWRFFRLWSLADGMDCPENQTRCVSNNYDIEGFWKNWHASYNQWLVRYMYIPLGGARWRAVNVWVIFTFVAIWHDLEVRLLGWAWLMCAFMLPELVLKHIAARPVLEGIRKGPFWRHICAACGAVNVLFLMTANMVGFVVGLDGAAQLLQHIFSSPVFVATIMVVLFSAVQIMFAIRDMEAAARQSTPKASLDL